MQLYVGTISNNFGYCKSIGNVYSFRFSLSNERSSFGNTNLINYLNNVMLELDDASMILPLLVV